MCQSTAEGRIGAYYRSSVTTPPVKALIKAFYRLLKKHFVAWAKLEYWLDFVGTPCTFLKPLSNQVA